jgi:hypothetical protein
MSDGFLLGGRVDPATGERTGDPVHYDPSDLTTHGVIVGMTGSGKTGLGIVVLEEALRSGIPTLILDPKGDMANLLLTFPDLDPADFRPWIDEAEAKREGKTPEEAAAGTARRWRDGLGGWGLGGSDIAALRGAAEFAVFTPGSEAGIPLDVIGSLHAPASLDDMEAVRDEIEGFVTGLLSLVGIEADPLADREHILLANLIEHAWASGEDLTLEALVGRVHRPPLRKLGVFDVETFFPEKDRLALAMSLNALVASPSFAAWRTGPPLDAEALLFTADGAPRASILSLAHLSDPERQFVVALALSRLITWMRAQPGSGSLRALVYMDEVFGFVPPTAMPPAKKPILTLMKTARAFGVGMLLATQNPVDLDYKAMSNAGTWWVGRLQTERDKGRILEALQSARGDADLARLDALVSGLGPRQFLLHNTREPEPTLFTTRWAMSYLAGPLTREQIGRLTEGHPLRTAAAAAVGTPELADDETTAMPAIAAGIPVAFADPGAPWLTRIGGHPSSTRLEAAMVVRVGLPFSDRAAGVDRTEEWEAVFHPLTAQFDPAAHIAVDYDDRDLRPEPPPGATYVLPDAPIGEKEYFAAAERAIADWLEEHRAIEILHNPALKLFSRVGETRREFEERCRAAAQDAADGEVAKIRDRFEGRIGKLRDQIERARLDVEAAAEGVTSERQEETLSGMGDLLGVLLGGRRSTAGMSRAASRRTQTKKAEQRLEKAELAFTQKVEDLDALEDGLMEEILEINARWNEKAGDLVVRTVEPGSGLSLATSLAWVGRRAT